MAINFNFIAKNQYGNQIKGKIAAQTEQEASAKLRMMNLRPVAVGLGSLNEKKENKLLKALTTKVTLDEKVVFTKQLSVMLDAGLSIIQALDMQAAQTSNMGLRRGLIELRENIEKGQDLAYAMAKQKHIFDSLYISIVKAGQTSGRLDVMLKKLSELLEKSNKFRKQLKSALSYPAFIIAFAGIMISVMLVYVVPMLAKNFTESGKPLPELTQMVVNWSNWLKENYVLFVGIIGGGLVGTSVYRKTPAGRKHVDFMMLRLPVFGPIIKKIAIARFANTMGTLIAAGVDLIESINICSKASGNSELEEALQEIKEGVQKGKGFSQPMLNSKLFPILVGSMVSIGEASGQLDAMLNKISVMYEEDVDAALAASLKLIEPVMFVVIGGIVGFILIAMYLPIFDLASTVGGN